jgi:transcriptional regulator with XRE-family HTH domain
MTGQELRRIRKRLGLTQEQLAEQTGVTGNSIARQERGEMGIRESLARLIRLLGGIDTKNRQRQNRH